LRSSILNVGCRWLGSFALAAMLVACSASPSPKVGLPIVATRAEGIGGASWMAPEAKSEDLLYLSDMVANDVVVYSYPRGQLVGTLSGFGKPRSECVDSSGNIWIADIEGLDVVEYAHGGTTPIASLSTFGPPLSCAVDPTTRDLAVSGGLSGTVVSIYHERSHGRWSDPKRYSDAALGVPYFGGYDSAGNLFIDGLTRSKNRRFVLAELPRRSQNFQNIAVSQSISVPGQVQWDGKHLAIGDSGVAPSVVYRFSIAGSTATEVGKTTLGGSTSVRQFWIAGHTLVGPDFKRDVGFWRYPAGGSPTKMLASVHGYGAAVSFAPQSK
jgi:hypothetical protein